MRMLYFGSEPLAKGIYATRSDPARRLAQVPVATRVSRRSPPEDGAATRAALKRFDLGGDDLIGNEVVAILIARHRPPVHASFPVPPDVVPRSFMGETAPGDVELFDLVGFHNPSIARALHRLSFPTVPFRLPSVGQGADWNTLIQGAQDDRASDAFGNMA